MTTPDDKSIDVLDAIYQDAALVAADEEITSEDREWGARVRVRMQARLAEMRRNLIPTAIEPVVARPIRPAYLAMARDALLARLDELGRRLGPTLQIAHRNLSVLTDDDLRRLLETLDAEPE